MSDPNATVIAEKGQHVDSEKLAVVEDSPEFSIREGDGEDILSMQDVDPALNAKMHIVNDAIDAMGWTPYHTKLFVLNGFGYAVDSMILALQTLVAGPAANEFSPSYPKALTIAVYVGMLIGALFWGLGADIIGRRFAFNTTLFVCSISGIVAGAAPSWASLAFFIAMVGFGGGGNLILDTAVFLEYLPSHKQWVLTLMAGWWGLGYVGIGLFAWGLLTPAHLNCVDVCTYGNNKGWRYLMFTTSGLVFVMSILRITVIRLKETPKFLLGEGKEEQLVAAFHNLATKYNRPCTITVAQLQACGTIKSAHGSSKLSLGEFSSHMRGLFANRKMALSTLLIWASWTLIGLAYPLFYVFLPAYLSSRGAAFGDVSENDSRRNYVVSSFVGIFGPVLAGFLCNIKAIGRKYTMVIGALMSMAFFFGYTQIKNEPSNVALSCVIGFAINVYYGTLYAYTPEVLPSAHRATGNGIAVACNRVMGILSAVIATVANTSTSVPIFLCAALYVALAAISIAFPYEPYGRRSS